MDPTTSQRYPLLFLNGMGVCLLLLVAVAGQAGIPLILLIGAVVLTMEYLFRFGSRHETNPYLFFLFAPLLLVKYASIPDFRLRILAFVFLAYIMGGAHTGTRVSLVRFFDRPRPGRIFITAFLVFALGASVLYLRGVHLSGDEPHYLMMTQSLVEDGDFDLKNNVEDRTYFDFLPVEIHPHLKKKGDRHLSFHMPGLSFLMVPFYLLFQLVKEFIPSPLFFRLALALVNALFALGLFYFLRIQFPRRRIGGYWLFFIATFPLLFHSLHLYPEIPAAALLLGAYLLVYGDQKNYLMAGLCLSLVLWLHVKYYPALLVFGMVVLIRLIRAREFRKLLVFGIFPLAGLLMLVVYCKGLYGSFSPAGIFPSADYLAIPHHIRLRALLGYFFDQRDGLLFYAPLFFLAFFSFKKRIRHQALLMGIALSYILAHAFSTVRGAHAPAGRPLIFVSWILIALAVNTILYWQRKGKRYLFRILTGFTLFILVWLLVHPLFVYQPVFSHTTRASSSLLTFLGSDTIRLSSLFPSFLNVRGPAPTANYVWLVLLALAVLLYYARPGPVNLQKKTREVMSWLWFLCLAGLLCIFPHVHLVAKNRQVHRDYAFYNNSRNLVYIAEDGTFRAKTGNRYELYLYRVRPPVLHFRVINHPLAGMRIRSKTRLLFDSRRQNQGRGEVRKESLKSLWVNERRVFHLEITALGEAGQEFLFFQIQGVP